jgi:hypothetical protein
MKSAGNDAGPKQGSTGPATQQLAELQLLTRADHVGMERGPLLVRSDTTLMLEIAEESSDDDVQETRADTADSSSFTARLAASRRLARTSSTTAESPSNGSADGRPDSPRHDLPILESWPSRTTTLPTLCEEADDPATDDGPEENAQVYKGDGCQTHGPTEAFHVETGGEKDCAIRQEAFEQMLEQLPYDANSLTLSIAHLSPQNLLRVRDAIAQCMALTTNRGGQEESPLPRMRIVRTMLAIDTLRLFWLRYGRDEVIEAVTNTIRRMDEQCVSDQAHSRGVLTARNITRVVLLVRDSLTSQAVQSQVDNNTAERSSPSRSRRGHGTPSKSCSASPSSWHTCRSPSSSYPSSPSYRGHSSSSPRRSILASDGTHVLMSEKLAMYQHRGDMNRLPSFKVRRQSDDTAEEAMKRRQRSIQYSSQVTKALHGYT